MKTNATTIRTALMTLVVILLTGCLTGPRYMPATIPEGQAVVYLYQSPRSGPPQISVKINVNGTPVVVMRDGGYYPYVTYPGRLEISARKRPTTATVYPNSDELTTEVIEVEAGREYYVECYYRTGMGPSQAYLRETDPDIVQRMIRDCKLLTP